MEREANFPPPARGYPRGGLKKIAFYLSGGPAETRFGYQLTWSDVNEQDHVVELGVVVVTDEMQEMLDRRYGRGVVRLFPELRPVGAPRKEQDDCPEGIAGQGLRMIEAYPPRPYFESYNLWRTQTQTGRKNCLTIVAGRQQDQPKRS